MPDGDVQTPPPGDLVGYTLLELLSRATADATALAVGARGDVLTVLAAFDPRARKVPAGRIWPRTDPLWTAVRTDRAVILGADVARRSAIVACGPGSLAIVGPAPPRPTDPDASTVVLLPSRLGGGALATAVPLVEHTAAALAGTNLLRQEAHQARREAHEAQRGLETARRDATETMRRLAAFAAEARTDPLTGLANRRALREHVLDAERTAGSPAEAGVLVIDLDGLKAYNDRNGHPAGDDLLVPHRRHAALSGRRERSARPRRG